MVTTFLRRSILALSLLAILTGTAMRFMQLDSKVYWHDEAHTGLRVSGYTSRDFVEQVFSNQHLTREELLSYQHPSADQGYQDTLRALMSRPEHGPLYYLLARLGFYGTEDARVATRGVAALLSLLLLPAAWWFWRELFPAAASPLAHQGRAGPQLHQNPQQYTHQELGLGAALLVALLALSPFQLVYAQEARQYGLWAALTLMSCAALLRARRLNTGSAWLQYALIVALGLYTHLMLAVVLVVQVLWLSWEWYRVPPMASARTRLLLALLGAGLLFSPWLALFFSELRDVGDVTGWMKRPATFAQLANAWGLHLTRQFYDSAALMTRGAGLFWLPFAALLALFALYQTARYAPPSARRLLLMLLVTTLAVVLGPDLLSGGRRSLEGRYLMPALLFLIVMWVFALTRQLQAAGRLRPLIAFTVWLGLLAAAFWSDVQYLRAEQWWNKSMSRFNHEVARMINSAEHPLVVCQWGDINPGEVLSVSYKTAPGTRFFLIAADYMPSRGELQGDIFVLNPSPNLLEHLSQFGRLVEWYPEGHLWRFYDIAPGEAGPFLDIKPPTAQSTAPVPSN